MGSPQRFRPVLLPKNSKLPILQVNGKNTHKKHSPDQGNNIEGTGMYLSGQTFLQRRYTVYLSQDTLYVCLPCICIDLRVKCGKGNYRESEQIFYFKLSVFEICSLSR